MTPAEDGQLSLRAQYREHYYRASLRLARGLLHANRPAEALPLLHSLLESEPLLEEVVRDAFRCHAALSDRAGLEAEEQRFRAALHQLRASSDDPEDDGPHPDPATAALFAELHHDLELRSAVPA